MIVESQQLEMAKLFLEGGYQVEITERREVITELLTLFGDKYGSRLQLIEK
ncbi:MAG: hypothetical protein Q8K60_09700 [Parachlamydiaceae bacterium]|nr:hypothetical protein [Parachlamydiaceae bacterium]